MLHEMNQMNCAEWYRCHTILLVSHLVIIELLKKQTQKQRYSFLNKSRFKNSILKTIALVLN
jgi:hypothetical protein